VLHAACALCRLLDFEVRLLLLLLVVVAVLVMLVV
jgi:hypothetical protein